MKKPNIITKKDSILGGSVHLDGEDKNFHPTDNKISRDLKKFGLSAEENVTITNPITGKSTDIVLKRDGTPESDLIVALADGDMPREKKDAILGMYLWQRGKENASFLVELFQYKGQHAKETQAFKKQMRFDYEMFVDTFCKFLLSQSSAIARSLSINLDDIYEEYSTYAKAHKGESITYNDVLASNDKDPVSQERCALIEMAIRLQEQVGMLTSVVQNVTESRLKEKGFGIYIDTNGKPYSIFDTDIVKKVEEDVIKAQEIKQDGTNTAKSTN